MKKYCDKLAGFGWRGLTRMYLDIMINDLKFFDFRAFCMFIRRKKGLWKSRMALQRRRMEPGERERRSQIGETAM